MPDLFEDLFADLRVATLPQVLPPGAEAARRTAHRRRTARTATAAAVVVAVAGGLGVAVPPLREGNRAAAAARVRDRVDTAKRAVDTQLPNVAVNATSRPVTTTSRMIFSDLPSGSYNLALACAGAGTVPVEVRLERGTADSVVLGGQVVACDETPRATYLTLRLPVAGSVVVTAAGDTTAVAGAGFAFDLSPTVATATQPAAPAPESTWNAARAAEVLAASGRAGAAQVTTERELDMGRKTPPGDYELALVCAGPGTLSLTVQAVGETGAGPTTVLEKQVQCRDTDPKAGETDLITLPENAGFLLSAVPDGPARNHAGWAYHLRQQ